MNFFLLILPFFYNYIYLYYRKSKIFKGYKKWCIIIAYFIIGIIFKNEISHTNHSMQLILNWSFATPLIFTFYISLCTFVSKRINNRDFKLYLRFSNEIDDLKPRKTKSKTTDKIISYTAIFLVLLLPYLIVIFF